MSRAIAKAKKDMPITPLKQKMFSSRFSGAGTEKAASIAPTKRVTPQTTAAKKNSLKRNWANIALSIGQLVFGNFISMIFQILYSNTRASQSSLLVYNSAMKKTLITSLIAVLAFVVPAFAETLPTKSDLTASAQNTKEAPLDSKKPETKLTLTKKQKTETDLRGTSQRLKLVIDRTQVLLDLLTKKDKETTNAQTALDAAKASLEEANSAIDQFSGIFPPEVKKGELVEETAYTPKEIIIFKDPLKKAQESLKSAKTSLLESIAELKDILIQKEASE